MVIECSRGKRLSPRLVVRRFFPYRTSFRHLKKHIKGNVLFSSKMVGIIQAGRTPVAPSLVVLANLGEGISAGSITPPKANMSLTNTQTPRS